MYDTTWDDVSENVAAGNISKVIIEDTLDCISFEIFYMCIYPDRTIERSIMIACHNYCYFDIRRRGDHEAGASMIVDAFLKTDSDLITALQNHKLDSVAGCLCLEPTENPIHHLEIIGEVSLNVICEKVYIKATPIRSFSAPG